MKKHKRHIWIIDDVYGADDADGAFHQRAFRARFGRDGVDFHFFSGRDDFLGRYAVSALQGYFARTETPRPDLILLDVNFGALPLGYEMLDWLTETHRTIPIVMLTSLERNSNLGHALDRGAVDFIHKNGQRAEDFWGVVERYLTPTPATWLVGHHGQFLQALFLVQRFAYGDRRRLLLQGVEDAEKNAIVQYVSRLCTSAFTTIDARNAKDAPDVSDADLLVITDADAADLSEQAALANLLRTLSAQTRVIVTTTDYLAARVKQGLCDPEFYDLVSEEVAHLPSLRERLSDVPLLLRRAIIAAGDKSPPPPRVPDQVVARVMASPAAAELSDLDSVAAAVLRHAGNVAALERELDILLGAPQPETHADVALREDTREQISDVERFLERVASHKSAYTVEHDGAELIVFPNVFSPRYSHSSDFLIQMLPVKQGDRVVDIGCGTGVLGIAALRRGAEHATFVDVNPDAVANTQTNLDRLGFAARGRIVLSDVYENVDGKFDLIVSNPPFWNKPAKTMLERSCFDENYAFLRKLIEGAAEKARPGARLAIVMSNQSDTALVQRLLAKFGWVVRDHRMAPARTGRGGNNHVRVAWICDRDPES